MSSGQLLSSVFGMLRGHAAPGAPHSFPLSILRFVSRRSSALILLIKRFLPYRAGYYPDFEAMQGNDLVLNWHGEMTSSSLGVTVLNADAGFIPQLFQLHTDIPLLRTSMEHVSTREEIDAVRGCGATI